MKWLRLMVCWLVVSNVVQAADRLAEDFTHPTDTARPWAYWLFMDGNLTREGMTADLEAMKRAGIGGVIMMEVDVGIPRGTVKFMSEPWKELFKHAVLEAQRLGLQITLNGGPGWTGSGGPWVKPEQSMQHLVASETTVTGPTHFDSVLPRPHPRKPFFGEQTLTPALRKQWQEFYRDVVVLAFPTPKGNQRIADIDEKALYYRAPYSSQAGVKPYLPAPASFPAVPPEQCIARGQIVDLTSKLTADGRLAWDVPAGEWTILRFGRTITGQVTRPAPEPGLGFECDKFDTAALDAHFEDFVGTLLKTVGSPQKSGAGWTSVHIDSWEMSSQNWSGKFREEFRQRRGYDLLRFLPVMLGRVVDSVEVSERFLWDLRRTAQELVVENHAMRLKELGRQHNMKLSIEPYDLNPAGDLALGGVADVPMCEFWSRAYGFNTDFSCFEAVSIAHTMGRPIVAAESFTSFQDGWRQYPAAMKQQGDWALCCGINRFVFHRYQHQPWLDRFPGMTFSSFGVHWDRTETWWDMVPAYHAYLARCQTMLRRGLPVADILYLDLEGAPTVFRPPTSATLPGLPDRRGYNFDGCAPGTLIERATVKNGQITFPDGMSYRLLVLPQTETMTPALLQKIKQLADAGATVVGVPPKQSPSLENYPKCDAEVQRLAGAIWKSEKVKNLADGNSPISSARWIWHNEGNPAASAPVGKRYFQRRVEIAGSVAVAVFTLTADNTFELFVNGHRAGAGDNFHNLYKLDVTALLKPGTNVLTVTAENTDTIPNPAGWIGALRVTDRDGKALVVTTDAQWSSALTVDGNGSPALDLGPAGMAPWHLNGTSDLYPNYETTAQILTKMNVLPDFESDGDVRYTHRRDKDAEIYFVGNRTAASITTECRFRVTGRQPELWNPVTGEQRSLPEFREQDGRTIVPLQFAPSQSYFVVFRKGRRPSGTNFPELKTVADLTGPWEVSFDPKWGGPERVTFAALDDWSKRPEAGIKFYSGTATYRKVFSLPSSGDRTFLDLGAVAVMARVKVNGRDCGIVWTSPYRVDITAAVKPGENVVEVSVANLWLNRLIGDSSLPAEKRLTWTTWNPYKPDSALQPSGLLGPVKLVTTDRNK